MRPFVSGRRLARLSLAASPSVIAAALALQPAITRAQAFQGTPTVTLGNVGQITSGNTDIFTANAAQNTINWVPTDTAAGPAPIDFLPAGATASFSGGAALNGGSYTVLNRIIAADPTRAIQLAGSVTSDAAGRIWFYAPGGLLLAGTAQFIVGGLLLTANDPVGAAAGLPYLDAGNNVRLAAAAGSTAAITVQAGAQINATNPGSYVVAVAPRFDMAGAINVNGSAALAAVGDVNLTLNGGLFDITANVGSDAGGTSSVTGSIGGPAGIGGQGVNHRVYLMAVPRNDAMTLLITGGAQIGFDVAAAADVNGNAVVLSGGYDIRRTPTGQGVAQFSDLPSAGGAAAATITIDGADFSSAVTLRSKNTAQVQSGTGGSSFADLLQVFGDQQATVRADVGNSVTVGANLVVSASTQFLSAPAGSSRTAGAAVLGATDGGSIVVTGAATVEAVGQGIIASSPGLAGGNGTGGTATVGLLGGSLQATSLVVDASGFGAVSIAGRPGAGLGGQAVLQIGAGGGLTLATDLVISAQAVSHKGEAGLQSGDAVAGRAQFRFDAGTVNVPGAVRVLADAFYSFGNGSNSHIGGGTITGGAASIDLSPGAALSADSILIDASGSGVFAVGNNSFIGGTAELNVRDVGGITGVTTQNGVVITAGATATDGVAGGNVNGGNATGGVARLIAQGSPVVTVVQGDLNVSAKAVGGNGAGGTGGNASGGRAHVDFQDGGTLGAVNLTLDASARGGLGTVGGNATAFDNGDSQPPAVFLRYGPGALIDDIGMEIASDVTLLAGATAGSGSVGVGGAARGGLISLVLESNDHGFGRLTLEGAARGGAGSVGGNARSGRAFHRIVNAGLTLGGEYFIDINAVGGAANANGAGRGGDGVVGQYSFNMPSLEAGPGATLIGPRISVVARATGGNGGSGTAGGGAGGNAVALDPNIAGGIFIGVQPARSTLTVDAVVIDNSARGGNGGSGVSGSNGGTGGTANGGLINIGVISGPVTPVTNQSVANFGDVSIFARQTGGNGGFADGTGLAGRGGNATGGNAVILTRGGIVTANSVTIDSAGIGGAAGFGGAGDLGGGDGTGGTAGLLATPHFTAGLPGQMVITGDVNVGADGRGGEGEGGGGIGRGGTARIELKRHEAAGAAPATTAGTLTIAGAVNLGSDGDGGNGRTGGNGGDGFAGTSTVFTQAGTTVIEGPIALNANGFGGIGGTGAQIGGGNGGVVNLGLDGGTMTLNGNVQLRATGLWGDATGGGIRITTTAAGGSLFANGDNLTIDASAGSGDGFEFGPAGDAFGGEVTIEVGAGSLLRLRRPGRDGSLFVTAAAEVSNLAQFSTNDAYGGGIRIVANGRLEMYGGAAADMILSVESRAGAGGSLLAGGEAFGGGMDISVNAGGSMLFDTEGRTLRFVTTSAGGDSGLLSGSGSGGGISLVAVGGTITTVGATLIESAGLAGSGTAGGIGRGGGITLQAQSGGTLAFGGPLTLFGRATGVRATGSDVFVNANTATISVAGDLNVDVNASFAGNVADIEVTGGSVFFDTVGTSVFNVTGGLNVSANGFVQGTGLNARSLGGRLNWNHRGSATITGGITATALAEYGDGGGGTATGGTMRISVLQGRLSTGLLDLSVNADGGVLPDASGLIATGGIIILETAAGAELANTGFTFLEASGQGALATAGTGGRGQGGQITLTNAGIMRFTHANGGFGLQADGDGGNGLGTAGIGGEGRGGSVAIDNLAGSSFAINAAFGSVLNADGSSGNGDVSSGAAVGGTATINNAANLNIIGDLGFSVQSRGRSVGADATGGTGRIVQTAGFMSVRGETALRGDAIAGTTGTATGGTLEVRVSAGALQFQNGALFIDGGAQGQNAIAGNITLASGGNLSVATDVDLLASTRAGFGSTQTVSTGGSISIDVAAGGRLQTGGRLDANAEASTDQANGGSARGGTITLNSAGTIVIGTDASLLAQVDHDGIAQNALSSRGGDITATFSGGTFTAGVLRLDTSARGLDGFTDGGSSTGGTVLLAASGGARVTTSFNLLLDSNSNAGGSNAGGAGGLATGGTSRMTVAGLGTEVRSRSVRYSLLTNGGNSNAGQGGDAVGGLGELLISNGGVAVFTDQVLMQGESFGGNLFNDATGGGGAATAATLRALVDGATGGTMSLAVAGFATFDGDTFGGDVLRAGLAGGAATGNVIQVGSTGNGGTVAIGNLVVSSYGQAGDGGRGPGAIGDGGVAQGGSVTIGMGRNTSSATPGRFDVASIDVFTGGRGGFAGNVGASAGASRGGAVLIAMNGAAGTVAGNARLRTYAESRNFDLPAEAVGGRIEVAVGDALNGSAGSLAFAGPVELSHFIQSSSDRTPYTPAVTRITAIGAGSQLMMQGDLTLTSTVVGNGPRRAADRSGIVAGAGARIDFASAATINSFGDFALNDGGTITATGDFLINTAGRVLASYGTPTAGATGTVTAPRVEIQAIGGIDIATGIIGGTDVLLATPGELRALDLRAGRNLQVSGDTGLSVRNASSGAQVTLASGGALLAGAIDAGTANPAPGETASVFVRAAGALTTGAVASARDIGLVAGGNLASGALAAGRDVILLTGGTITTDAIATSATSTVRFDDVGQSRLIDFGGIVPDYAALLAAAPSTLSGAITINGGVTTGVFEARTTAALQIRGAINSTIGTRLSGGALQLSGLSSQGFLDIFSVDSVVLGDVSAPGVLSISSNGSITIGNIIAGSSLVLATNRPGTSLTTGNVRAAADIRLSSATALTTGSLSAGNRVFLSGGGAITAGAIDAGTANPLPGAAGVLFATSPATIQTGAISVAGSATLSGVLGVTTGNIAAPAGIVLLDTGAITTGTLSTGVGGFVYVAAHDLLPQITFDQAGNPQFAALLNSTPVRLVGDVTIGGGASTGRFVAAATGAFNAQSITAPNGVLVDVGGLATLAGSIASSNIAITSGDIAIGAGAVIGGDTSQSVSLNSDLSATAAVVGGPGVAAPGTYSLSAAEFVTLRATSVSVRSGAMPMTLDALSLPATLATVTLQGAAGLRVTGAVSMAQATSASRLNLIAGTRIEVVQGTGSLRLGTADAPAGTLSLQAPRVWVASDALLGQLGGGLLSGAARDTALNAATAPAVAGGSVGAGTILVSVGNELLVQNSGTATLRAGFTAGSGGLRISRLAGVSTPIDVVISGRIQRADASFATNNDVLALAQFDPGTSIVTANSAVNACLVQSGCPVPPPPPAGLDPGIAQPVLTIANNVDALTPEEEAQREEAQAAAEKLPIVLLQRLIDFSPMFADPDATDPVTSGGNPALWRDPVPTGGPAPGGVK